MDICLLTSFHSFHSRSSFIHRLAEEGQKLGARLHLVNPTEVTLESNSGKTTVLYQGRPLPKYHLTHYALRWDDDHTWSIVEELNAQHYITLPVQRMPLGDSITMARLFAKHGIKTPRTWVLAQAGQVPLIMQDLSFPCMFRVRRGQKGRSVYKVHHMGEALSLAEQLSRNKLGLVVQELLEPTGVDTRAVVVGGKIIAAVDRKAANDYLRPAEDRNAEAIPTTLTKEESTLVLAAAHLYQAPYAAVNFLRRGVGHPPMLLDVSRAPALSEVEAATRQNIAGAIMAFLVAEARKH